MELNPYLHFDGQCEEAFRFYERCLGGTIAYLGRYEGSPMAGQVPEDWRGKVMHATLQVGTQSVMGCDAPPGRFERPQGFRVTIGLQDAAEAERIFGALAEGGKVDMPLTATFWAERFGMLSDRFGIPWMINCAAPAPTPDEQMKAFEKELKETDWGHQPC